MVRFHPHARERLAERGATEEEVRSTVLKGETFSAKFGRTGFRRNFRFDSSGAVNPMQSNRLKCLLCVKEKIGL